MGGGLMQLVAIGTQNDILFVNPQISFYKTVYYRHTNFSIESIENYFNGNPQLGQRITSTIARNGDLLKNLWLEVEMEGDLCNSTGHSLIEFVQLEVGGQIIDTHYGEWMEVSSELTLPEEKCLGYNKMINKKNKFFPGVKESPSFTLLSVVQLLNNTYRFTFNITKNDINDPFTYEYKLIIPKINVEWIEHPDFQLIFSSADDTFMFSAATVSESKAQANNIDTDTSAIKFMVTGVNENGETIGQVTGRTSAADGIIPAIEGFGFFVYKKDAYTIIDQFECPVKTINMGEMNDGQTVESFVDVDLSSFENAGEMGHNYYWIEYRRLDTGDFVSTVTEPNGTIKDVTTQKSELNVVPFPNNFSIII